MGFIIPPIPGVPRSLDQDTQVFLSAVKYNLEAREGQLGDEHRFITKGELDGEITQIYKSAKGQNFIEKVSNFLGTEVDLILSDINGDGILKIATDGLIWIDTAVSGTGLVVATVEGGAKNGWLMFNDGLFSWSGNDELHAFILDTITWQGIAAGTGDAFIGDYANGAGIWFDKSESMCHAAMDLSLESIPGFPSSFLCYFDVEFTEGYGTVVHDGSNQHATGTCYNTPTWTGQGPLGKCIRFIAASSQYVDFGTNAYWDVLPTGVQDMSWSFWIYITGAPAAVQVPWSKGVTDVRGWYFVVNTDGTVSLRINKSGSNSTATTTSAISYNAWNNLVFVYNHAAADAGTIDIYVNGVFDKTVTGIVTQVSGSVSDMNIGRYGVAASNYTDGYFQAFKLWNRTALTAKNVQALYKYPQGARGGQLGARSVMVGSAVTTTGFLINDTGQWSYAQGLELHGISLAASIPWQRTTLGGTFGLVDASFVLEIGSAVIGGYNYTNPATGYEYGGLFWDQLNKEMNVRGALVASAVVPSGGSFEFNANLVFPDAGGSNWGLIFLDASEDFIGTIDAWSTDSFLSQGWYGMAIGTLGYPTNYDLIFYSRLGTDYYAENGACYVFQSPYGTTGTKEAFILPSINSARDGTKIYGVHLGALNYKFLGLWVRDGGRVEIGDATYPFILNVWNGSGWDSNNAYIS